MTSEKVLAIDPGFERVGIAVIERTNNAQQNIIFSECFKTSSKIPFSERLLLIGKELDRVIKKYKPISFAIEKLYFTTNQKTVMGVAEARGMMIYIAEKNNLNIFEYTPPQIKVAVTGYGKASKSMVIDMVHKLVRVTKDTKSDDEIDAIAIGLTQLACEKPIHYKK